MIAPDRRFLTMQEVQDELAVTGSQVYALIRARALRAIKIGARGQYRIERGELEAYIERAYAETERFLEENPHGGPRGPSDDDTEPDATDPPPGPGRGEP